MATGITARRQGQVEHETALDLPRFDQPMRLSSLFQAEDALDAGCDPPGLEQAEERREIVLEPFRMAGPATRDVVENDPPRRTRPRRQPLDAQEVERKAKARKQPRARVAGLVRAPKSRAIFTVSSAG